MKLARTLVIIGALLLLLSALLHCYGYFFIIPQLAATNISSDLLSAFKALWWMFSAVGILLCPIFIGLTRLPNSRGLVLLGAAIPIVTTILLLYFVGVFIGSIGMALASVFLVIGGFLLPGDARG